MIMKTFLSLLTFFIFYSVEAQIPVFKYTDSIFKIGAIHTVYLDYAYYDISKSFHGEYKNAKVIDSISTFLTKNNNLIVEIGSHAGIRSSKQFCLELTKKRAESLKMELIERGIKQNQLVAKSYGKEKPLYNEKRIAELKIFEEKEIAHFRNDRIELKILEIK